MRKNLNKLATLALSGMMVMSMTAPAFAKTVNITKRVHTDGMTLAPDTTFNFTVKPATESSDYTYNGVDNKQHTEKTKKGIDGAVTVKGATFAPVEKDFGKKGYGDKHYYFDSNIEIKVNDNAFTDTGVYEYSLEENNGEYEGIYYTKAKFKIYVYIYNDKNGVRQEPVVTVVRVADANGNKVNDKVEIINNNYGWEKPKNPDPNTPPTPDTPPVTPDIPETPGTPDEYDSTHEVNIRKNVSGAFADKTKDSFEFYITVTPANRKGVNNNEKYNIEAINNAGLNGQKSVTAGTESHKIDIKDTDGVRITGLTKGDLVTVREGENSYTMTVAEGMEQAKNTYVTNLTYTGFTSKFNVIKDDAEVEVKNTKDGVTPTGIVMNVAPYAMMLAVAGGLGVVFMNRKKEEE